MGGKGGGKEGKKGSKKSIFERSMKGLGFRNLLQYIREGRDGTRGGRLMLLIV